MCDLPDFYNETCPRARKAHSCGECHRLIGIGERYVRCAGKFDGSVFSETFHSTCQAFRRKVEACSKLDSDCGIPFGYLDEAMRDPDEWGIEACNVPSLREEWARIKAGMAP